jgi:signal transduction histidine kinase
MLAMQNISIKHKLILITMLTCVAALLSAAVGLTAWEWTALRRTMVQNLSTQAEMTAENCKASLAFQVAKDAEETLKALHVEPSIVFGCVYNKDGKFFATYYRDFAEIKVHPSEFMESGSSFSDGYLTVFRPIVLDGEITGIVCLRSDLRPMYAMLKRNIFIIIAVLLFASLVAYLVSTRIQGIISRPILSLAGVAKGISEKKDYSTRALKSSNDEVGLLIDAFNEMLEQIQHRDFELVDAKGKLEVRVEERTADLSTANEQLKQEVVVRKRSERRQAQLLKELESANRELKDFAYIVSHDLKAPLRGIKTLSEWLSADYADKLSEQGKEQMGLLLRRVERMHNLIEGILQYSRVGRVKENRSVMNLNKVVADVIDMIVPPENITITVENELPTIEFEPTRIAQVFQNLMSNAIKYMDKPQGQIKIGCIEENGFWKFNVTDNGPGIEEKHFEKIFQLFQTLAPRDQVESTGVGLTITKKIVELYGGKIWIESKVGEGSTFFFTLPKQEMGVKDANLETSVVS